MCIFPVLRLSAVRKLCFQPDIPRRYCGDASIKWTNGERRNRPFYGRGYVHKCTSDSGEPDISLARGLCPCKRALPLQGQSIRRIPICCKLRKGEAAAASPFGCIFANKEGAAGCRRLRPRVVVSPHRGERAGAKRKCSGLYRASPQGSRISA